MVCGNNELDEVALWALCRITHPRKGDSANFMHISDEELEYHSCDPAGNAAYRSGHPSEIGLQFGHYCPKHAMSKWAKVFKLAWTPLRQYQPTRARRHFIDGLEVCVSVLHSPGDIETSGPTSHEVSAWRGAREGGERGKGSEGAVAGGRTGRGAGCRSWA